MGMLEENSLVRTGLGTLALPTYEVRPEGLSSEATNLSHPLHQQEKGPDKQISLLAECL